MGGSVDVHGGAGGIEAHAEHLRALGGRFGGAAADSLHSSASLHASLVDLGSLGSAVLDPVGWARFEGELLLALDGPRGLSALGLACGAMDGELRVAALTYETVDTLGTDLQDEIAGVLALPGALAQASATLARTGSPIDALQAIATTDPQLADAVADTLGIPEVLEAGARALPDGHGEILALGTDPAAAAPPRQLTDVIGELAHRNDDEAHHGAIDVRILTLADGSRRVIVDITGTKSWSLKPTGDVTSLPTNGRALVGQPTAYEQGVLKAMRAAGVRRTDKVMLVGHSEGGMVAVNTARDAVRSGEFDVTHVVTAGSPIGLTAAQVPRQVRVLALENTRDVVPHLDGRANPDTPNVTTASSAHGDGTIHDDHSLEDGYGPVARDVQSSSDASIRDFLTSADDYFHGDSVVTHAYQVVRRY